MTISKYLEVDDSLTRNPSGLLAATKETVKYSASKILRSLDEHGLYTEPYGGVALELLMSKEVSWRSPFTQK